MSGIGIVVVSHSTKAAEGACEIAAEMGGDDAVVVPAGGDVNDEIGTSVQKIETAIRTAAEDDGVVLLVDLGSAVINAEIAAENTEFRTAVADAPLLEGTLNAVVEVTNPNTSFEAVVEAAEEARNLRKLS